MRAAVDSWVCVAVAVDAERGNTAFRDRPFGKAAARYIDLKKGTSHPGGNLAQSCPANQAPGAIFLNVILQRELVGMRPQAYSVCSVLAVVGDESFEPVFAKDIALNQEVVILFKASRRRLEPC